MNNINEQANALLSADGFESAAIPCKVKLTAAAREWDRRREAGKPWPSLAKRKETKTGYVMSWIETFSELEKNKTVSIPAIHKDGREGQSFLSVEGGKWYRFPATDAEVAWATAKSFAAPNKLDHGLPWWETGAAYKDELTGTGSKDAPQSPCWGYKIPKQTPNLRHRIDNNVGPVFPQVMSLPSFLVGNEYTPCAPSKEEVTQVLPADPMLQLRTFGHVKLFKENGSFWTLVNRGHSTKYEHKEAALSRALGCAFRSRDMRPCELVDNPLYLSTSPSDEEGEGSSWIPTSSDPMDRMMAKEELKRRAREARNELNRLEQLLGKEKFQILCMAAEGRDSKEIAVAIGKTEGSAPAIRQALKRIRKQLQEVA